MNNYTFKINDNFVFKLDSNKIAFTSVLPDMNEIYKFEGVSAIVLQEWFNSKDPILEKSFWEKKLQVNIVEHDWKNFMSFVIEKKLILPKS